MEGFFNIKLIEDIESGDFKCPFILQAPPVTNSFNWSSHSERYRYLSSACMFPPGSMLCLQRSMDTKTLFPCFSS